MMVREGEESITSLLRKAYFWDVDITPGKTVSKRLVIERIFCLGTLTEIALVLQFYGKEEVEKTLCNLNYIDPKTLNFVSKYFGRSKKTFNCYTRKQLIPQLWNC
jgi:hypothetical protein